MPSAKPEAIIRHEPEGAVITPPLFHFNIIFVDEELAALIHQKSFRAEEISNETAALLINSGILASNAPEEKNYRETYVEVNGLPAQVIMDITSACNCDCVMCYHETDLEGYTPPLDNVLRRITKLKELGIGLFEVSGGEPLLRKDLTQILNHIAQLGLHFYIVTNGEYLKDMNDELLSAIKRGLGVVVSLDGTGETHDRIRRRKGLYSALLLGLDFLFENEVKIYFVSTLNKENLSCIPEMVSLAKRHATTIQFRPVLRAGGAVTNEVRQPDGIDEFREYLSHPNVWNNFIAKKKTIPEARFYGCSIRKRISVDSRGILFPCAFDRNRSFLPIEEYNRQSLVNELKREVGTFAEKHNLCSRCELGSGTNPNCDAFCRFSLTYNKGRK